MLLRAHERGTKIWRKAAARLKTALLKSLASRASPRLAMVARRDSESVGVGSSRARQRSIGRHDAGLGVDCEN